MAGFNTVPLNCQDILDLIHTKYEAATDTPLLTDDDGIIRLRLLNEGINHWETDDNPRWRELWVYNNNLGAIVANQIAYPISLSDFRELGSRLRYLRADGSRFYIDLVSQETYARNINQSLQVACISGNPSVGYQLNLGWVPALNDGTVGAIGYHDYYKFANRMILTTDIPEMSNPYYLVDYVTAELFVNDDTNLYEKFSADADAKLEDMRTENEALPPYESNAIEDVTGDLTYSMG